MGMTLSELIDEAWYEKHPEDIPEPEVNGMDIDDLLTKLNKIKDDLDADDLEVKLLVDGELGEINDIQYYEGNDAVILISV